MIADWTVDVGPESPMIVLPWEGWIDLRSDADAAWPAERAARLTEAAQYPELLQLLEAGNRRHTATAKVDVFPVTREEVDPEIAEAGLEASAHGLCSYLDLVPTRADCFREFAAFEQVARNVAAALNDLPLSSPVAPPLLAVAEVVVRPAHLYDRQTFGWTLYAAGFGADEVGARNAWFAAATLILDTAVQKIAGAESASSHAQLRALQAIAAKMGE
jgi:hypothetical protein